MKKVIGITIAVFMLAGNLVDAAIVIQRSRKQLLQHP